MNELCTWPGCPSRWRLFFCVGMRIHRLCFLHWQMMWAFGQDAGRGEVWQCEAGQGEARQGGAGRGKARRGVARPGSVWPGEFWQGGAWRGLVWLGKAGVSLWLGAFPCGAQRGRAR